MNRFQPLYSHIPKSILTDCKLVSCDIFDTLLFRFVANFTDIFTVVAQEAIKRDLLPYGMHPEQFRRIRIQAEKNARNKHYAAYHSHEILFSDIYNEIPSVIQHHTDIMQIEYETEKRTVWINPHVESFLYQCYNEGKKIILSSDMYFNSQQLLDFLQNKRFNTRIIERIYVSCEQQATKRNGSLYEIIKKDYIQYYPREILHLGDFYLSDFQQAKACGIQAYHYQMEDSTQYLSYERVRYSYPLLPELQSLRKLGCYHLPQKLSKQEEFFYLNGWSVAGPYFTLFGEWIRKLLLKEGIKLVLPFMREGKVLTQLLSNLHHEDTSIIPLFISRQAIFFASIPELNESSLLSFFDKRDNTISDLFEELSLVIPEELFRYKSISLTTAKLTFIGTQSLQSWVVSYFLQPNTLKRLHKTQQDKKKLIYDYFRSLAQNEKRVVTVDIGFAATIQQGLQRIIHQFDPTIHFIHLLCMGNEKTADKLSQNMDIRSFSGDAGKNLDLIQTICLDSPPIEQLLLHSEGSTIGYKMKKGQASPIMETNPVPKKEIHLKELFQQGMLDFQLVTLPLFEANPWLLDKLLLRTREILQILHRHYDFPTEEEALYIGNLHNDVNYGSKRIISFCNDYSIDCDQDSLDNFMAKALFSQTYRIKNNAYWPQGIITRASANYLYKYYLQFYESSLSSLIPYYSDFINVVQCAIDHGIDSFCIYGTGQGGKSIAKIAMLHNLSISSFVETTPSQKSLYNIPIFNIRQAYNKGCHVYLIASTSFYIEIKQTIINFYKKTNIQPTIFHVNM